MKAVPGEGKGAAPAHKFGRGVERDQALLRRCRRRGRPLLLLLLPRQLPGLLALALTRLGHPTLPLLWPPALLLLLAVLPAVLRHRRRRRAPHVGAAVEEHAAHQQRRPGVG